MELPTSQKQSPDLDPYLIASHLFLGQSFPFLVWKILEKQKQRNKSMVVDIIVDLSFSMYTCSYLYSNICTSLEFLQKNRLNKSLLHSIATITRNSISNFILTDSTSFFSLPISVTMMVRHLNPDGCIFLLPNIFVSLSANHIDGNDKTQLPSNLVTLLLILATMISFPPFSKPTIRQVNRMFLKKSLKKIMIGMSQYQKG